MEQTLAEILLAISLSFCGQTAVIEEALEQYGNPAYQEQHPEVDGMVIVWDTGVDLHVLQIQRVAIESCLSSQRNQDY